MDDRVRKDDPRREDDLLHRDDVLDPVGTARRETSTEPVGDVSHDYDPSFRRTGRWPDPEVERAQPGDVLGIERAGETTELGDTAEDEDKRRRDAEKKR